jgi:hypothetical protein
MLFGVGALLVGHDFTVQRFFDEFLAAGVIPVSLVRWEMTGNKAPFLDQIARAGS